jgi:hypothetical protein
VAREIVKPILDQPIIVRLDHGPLGTEKRTDKGTDFQYVINHDEGIMWLPPDGRDALLKCMARAGDTVEILKTKRGAKAFFAAQVLPDDGIAPPPAPTAAPAKSYRADAYPPPHNYPRPAPPPRPLPPSVYYQPEPEPYSGPATQQLVPAPQPAPAPAPPPAAAAARSGQTTMTDKLARCLICAVDAAQVAAAHAKAHGLALAWTSEDIRAMGLSVFINLQREGR